MANRSPDAVAISTGVISVAAEFGGEELAATDAGSFSVCGSGLASGGADRQEQADGKNTNAKQIDAMVQRRSTK